MSLKFVRKLVVPIDSPLPSHKAETLSMEYGQ